VARTDEIEIAQVLDKHESAVLKDWIRAQITDGRRSHLISDADLQHQSNSFLSLLRAAVQSGQLRDIQGREWDEVRRALEDLKSSRGGFYALVGYTFAKAMDNGFSDGLGTASGSTYFPLPGTAKADWALSQISLTHNFTASIIYDLPFGKGHRFGNDWGGVANAVAGGWQVNVIEKITSGFPLFIVTSNNQSGVTFASNTIRPDQVCNGKKDGTDIGQFFDTGCFVDPVAGGLGNASRTPLYGPGFVNTDFSAVKQFQLPREGMHLEFRAEFFNLFNHPQFFTPGQDAASSDFGIISRTVNNPRLIQFALKFSF